MVRLGCKYASALYTSLDLSFTNGEAFVDEKKFETIKDHPLFKEGEIFVVDSRNRPRRQSVPQVFSASSTGEPAGGVGGSAAVQTEEEAQQMADIRAERARAHKAAKKAAVEPEKA